MTPINQEVDQSRDGLLADTVLVEITRPDDYADVHPDLVVDDFCTSRGKGFSWRIVSRPSLEPSEAVERLANDIVSAMKRTIALDDEKLAELNGRMLLLQLQEPELGDQLDAVKSKIAALQHGESLEPTLGSHTEGVSGADPAFVASQSSQQAVSPVPASIRAKE